MKQLATHFCLICTLLLCPLLSTSAHAYKNVNEIPSQTVNYWGRYLRFLDGFQPKYKRKYSNNNAAQANLQTDVLNLVNFLEGIKKNQATQRSFRLSWQAPTKRKDGQSLAKSDIKQFEIYITSGKTGKTHTVRIKHPTQTSYTSGSLKPDTYFVAMITLDKNNRYSELSKVVSKKIY